MNYSIMSNATLKMWAMCLITLMLLAPTTLSAQKQARELFTTMPDSILPLLTAVNRADCIDFIDSKMKAKVSNRLDATVEMTELAPDYIKLTTSKIGTWQMKVLAVNDSTQVVCVVNTVCAPACDSNIAFYSTSWEPLATTGYLPELPAISDFLKVDKEKAEELRTAIDAFNMRLIELNFTAESTTLQATLTTADYVCADDLKKVEPYLTKSLNLEWKEGKFALFLK